MSIQSTQYWKRDWAISRILEVDELLAAKNYRELEEITSETHYNLQEWVDGTAPLNVTEDTIENWTNDMLADKMDEPFYRRSLFDNYYVLDEDVWEMEYGE